MKEYLFTPFIRIQAIEFTIMLFTGTLIFFVYYCLQKYVFKKINNKWMKSFVELQFFVIAAIFTGGVIDYCCNCKLTAYMAVAFLLGFPASRLILRR